MKKNLFKSFLHCADLHLGFNQFNLSARFDDFDNCFGYIVNVAIEQRVDYFLIAGDIFNKRNINAATLDVAIKHLKKLQDSGINAIAIEGNHDQAHYHDKFSWMHYLYKNGYIKLLKPNFIDGKLVLNGGAADSPAVFYEDDSIRIYGLGYHGNNLADRLRELASCIQVDDRFTVLMAHGGVGGIEIGRLSIEDLRPFYDLFDYFALGHQHTMQVYEDRVYIPGAPEYYDLGEAGKKKGFFVSQFFGKEKTVTFWDSKKRAVIDIRFELTSQNWQDNMAVLAGRVRESCPGVLLPLVRIELVGQTLLNISAQDLDDLRVVLQEVSHALYVEVIDNTGIEQLAMKYDTDHHSISAIERAIILDELNQNPKYQEYSNKLADFIVHFKHTVLEDPAFMFEDLKAMDVAAFFSTNSEFPTPELPAEGFYQPSLF